LKLSYAITVCNEHVEIQKLVTFLLDNKRTEDNIVILFDKKNGSKMVEEFLRAKSVNSEFQFWRGFFEGHFADWKNKLKDYCEGDYIFQIDADEIPKEVLIGNLPTILESNPDNEVYLVPRVNTVEGLTQEHIDKWNWKVNQLGWVNWPDYQWRIWKNLPEIKWVNKVHEKLTGHSSQTQLPANDEFCLIHPKTIDRQEKQNSYYETL